MLIPKAYFTKKNLRYPHHLFPCHFNTTHQVIQGEPETLNLKKNYNNNMSNKSVNIHYLSQIHSSLDFDGDLGKNTTSRKSHKTSVHHCN